MSTRPSQNQISFHEKIKIHNNATEDIIVDIAESTVHKINAVGNINIRLFFDKNIHVIPDNSWINLTLIIYHDGNGNYEISFNNPIGWALGIKPILGNENQPTIVNLMSLDSGLNWLGMTSGNYFVL